MNVPDLYFEEYWGLLNEELDGGTYHSYTYEDENGLILYRFIKRPTNILPDTYDIVTPWGFSGPIIINCNPEKRKKLVLGFNEDFQHYCIKNNITSEYIRFSPWLQNHNDFIDVYNIKYNKYTLGIDLTKDFFNEEFSTEARRSVRIAKKKDIKIQFDSKCKTVDEFYRLYTIMAERNNIYKVDRLSRKYISDTIKLCGDCVFIINALHEDTIISSGIFIYTDNYLHYHLNGNDPKYFPFHASSLIYFKGCEWGKNNGKTILHIGGGGQEPEDSLLHFKRQFTRKGYYDFYIGSKIRLNSLYNQLVELKGICNDDFFPAYR